VFHHNVWYCNSLAEMRDNSNTQVLHKSNRVDILMNLGKKQCHKRRMFSNAEVGSTAAVSRSVTYNSVVSKKKTQGEKGGNKGGEGTSAQQWDVHRHSSGMYHRSNTEV
jgi:hypothetical protein